ncbi:SDR family oxidoreductase [Paraconexibacter sp.]|uniref:SDR family oxidoreductase n=1 Tax=Paraconexibacter sp. TaxID=2949640 RepID=UPI0035653F01
MDIAIAGGHGQIAQHLIPLLVSRGDRVRGLIRKPEQADDLRNLGAEPVLLDLENADDSEVAEAVRGADAIVFAAGAGPGSGPERKMRVDRDGAVKLTRTGVGRFVMLSSMGADDPPEGDETFAVYLRAKAQADDAVKASGMRYAILRPGALTDEAATGRVEIAPSVPRGEIPREDVARILAEILAHDEIDALVVEATAGTTPVADAVSGMLGD